MMWATVDNAVIGACGYGQGAVGRERTVGACQGTQWGGKVGGWRGAILIVVAPTHDGVVGCNDPAGMYVCVNGVHASE